MFDPEEAPDFYDSTSFREPLDIGKVAEADDKYVVIGEHHPDPDIADEVIIPLLETGKFDTVLLEAFTRGPVVRKPDKKRLSYLKHGTYTWNPEKYDRITEKALENEVNIYGLDSKGSRMTERMELASWALETVKKTEGKSLIVIGNAHTEGLQYLDIPTRREYRPDASLEHMLPEKAATVNLAKKDSNFDDELEPVTLDEGLYRSEDIPRYLPEKFVKSDRNNFVFVK